MAMAHSLAPPSAGGPSERLVHLDRRSIGCCRFFFKPVHQSHLLQHVPELERFLDLPPGMRFLIAPGNEDVWEGPSLLQVD